MKPLKIKVKDNIKVSEDIDIHALVWKEGKWYVSKGIEIMVASQGKTKKEAIKNLKEAVSLYLEDEKVIPKSGIKDPELVSIYA